MSSSSNNILLQNANKKNTPVILKKRLVSLSLFPVVVLLREVTLGVIAVLVSVVVAFYGFEIWFTSHMERKLLKTTTFLEEDFQNILQTRKNAAAAFIFMGAAMNQLVSRLFVFQGASNRNKTFVFLQRTTRCLSVTLLVLLMVLMFINFHFTVTFRPLLERYRWNDVQKELSETYYQRDCNDHQDISTNNLSDLIVLPEWDSTRAAENILTHGASVFPALIDRDTAEEFRNYTLQRNAEMSSDELVFVMNTYSSKRKRQTRWSFAFSAHSDPSVPKVLQQVVSNKRLRETLELFLGPDPAIIKMQTITAISGAEHQGWHPDVNAMSSVKSFARDFMMHFSLFIPVQDTTPEMGATGICPGTQYCSSIDDQVKDSNACGQVFSGYSSDNVPIWFSGDGVLMNQNTFHKGWAYTANPTEMHRTIIVITFTSRPRMSNGKASHRPTFTPLPSVVRRRTHPVDVQKQQQQQQQQQQGNVTAKNTGPLMQAKSSAFYNHSVVSSLDAQSFPVQSWHDEAKLIQPETRVLSLGTPLTSFGHTMYDLRDSIKSMSTICTTLRFLGLYKPPEANWGWDYVTTFMSRMATDGHLFKREDLQKWLQDQKKLGFPYSFYVKHVVHEYVPATQDDRGIWDVWYSRSLEKAIRLFQKGGKVLVGIYFFVSFVVASTGGGGSDINSSQHDGKNRFCHKAKMFLQSCWKLVKAVSICAILLGLIHWRIMTSPLVRDIQSGRKLRDTFPNMTATLPSSSNISPPISLVPMAGVRLITHGRQTEVVDPERNDVLIGTRFDSLYLRIVNRILDYHTGNKEWRRLVRDMSYKFPHVQLYPKVIQDIMVNDIVQKVRGRFLLQSPELGSFIVMTADESRRYTRRALLMESNSMLFGVDQTIAYMISQMRYESPLRATPLTMIAVGHLEQVRATVFGELETGNECTSATQLVLAPSLKKATRKRSRFSRTPLPNVTVQKPLKPVKISKPIGADSASVLTTGTQSSSSTLFHRRNAATPVILKNGSRRRRKRRGTMLNRS